MERFASRRQSASPENSPHVDIGANLSPQQRRLLQNMVRGEPHEEELLQKRRVKQHEVKKAQKALIGKMMTGWTSQ